MSTVPEELRVRNISYIFADCNPYQKIIYQQLSIQIDELKKLKELRDAGQDTEKETFKAIGVLEYFEKRFKAFATVTQPKNIYS